MQFKGLFDVQGRQYHRASLHFFITFSIKLLSVYTSLRESATRCSLRTVRLKNSIPTSGNWRRCTLATRLLCKTMTYLQLTNYIYSILILHVPCDRIQVKMKHMYTYRTNQVCNLSIVLGVQYYSLLLSLINCC